MFRYLVFSLFVCKVYLFPSNSNDIFQAPENGKIWAFLVAGSETWGNYRHQADVCHAYHVLHRHGIPDEQIVVMMKDDIAYNSLNPTPGIILNHPNGSNVYEGVPHDYTGNDVSPENFLAVLQGNPSGLRGKGSGKVINSGPNDHIFIYFADHGAAGVIMFPGQEFSARDLNKAIQNMYDKKKYRKVVFYLEACDSGSMFENLLPNNTNVYATTAASPYGSSYGCYYDPVRKTLLGDVYSVSWMEDSDKEVLTEETLRQQYKIVKGETTESEVMEFGDLNMGRMPVSEFQGRKREDLIILPKAPLIPVNSRDAPLFIAKSKVLDAQSSKEKAELQKEVNKIIRNRLYLLTKVKQIVQSLSVNDEHVDKLWQRRFKLRDYDCYDTVRRYFNEECFKLSMNEYALGFMYVLVNLCENGIPPSTQKHAMEKICVDPPMYGIV